MPDTDAMRAYICEIAQRLQDPELIEALYIRAVNCEKKENTP